MKGKESTREGKDEFVEVSKFESIHFSIAMSIVLIDQSEIISHIFECNWVSHRTSSTLLNWYRYKMIVIAIDD